MERVVVSGASRGLGLEFCRQYLHKGDCVVALHRNSPSPEITALKELFPERIELVTVNMKDVGEIRDFGEQISPLSVDILINNAGIIGPETKNGEEGQRLGSLEPSVFIDLFSVNALGPLLLTEALIPSFEKSARPRAFVMGSTVSLPDETFGDYYAYRMSKAAVDIAFATLAKDLSQKEILVATICPGWVRTDMGGTSASMSVEDSVQNMITTMGHVSQAESGAFLDSSGRRLR